MLTTKRGLVKLADFGVATKLSEVDSSKRRVVGTPNWMAPEIIQMSGFTTAADIWSVGCTVLELTTGAPPRRPGWWWRPAQSARRRGRAGVIGPVGGALLSTNITPLVPRLSKH